MSKRQIIKIIVSVLIAALTALGAAIGLQSCNIVRTISNRLRVTGYGLRVWQKWSLTRV